jgi:hypothetical protein
MKYSKPLFLLLTIVLLLQSACKKNNSEDGNSNIDLNGTVWKVSYYWDKKDETTNLAPYTFMFSSNGLLMAHTTTSVVNGRWSETSTRLSINFGTDPVLSEINGNWLKTEKTASTIKLKDDNPSQDDQLHFIKN